MALCCPGNAAVATPPRTVSDVSVLVSKPVTSSASSRAMYEPTVPLSAGAPLMVLRKCLTEVSTGDAMDVLSELI